MCEGLTWTWGSPAAALGLSDPDSSPAASAPSASLLLSVLPLLSTASFRGMRASLGILLVGFRPLVVNCDALEASPLPLSA